MGYFRTARSWASQGLETARRPGRLVRTLGYHGRLLQLSGRSYPGLHLGCGPIRIPGFCNIDASPASGADIVGGIERIRLATGSVDVIYTSHVFEHIPRGKAERALREWHRVLRPGGRLLLAMPDLEALTRVYLENLARYDDPACRWRCDQARDIIYGGQTNDYDFHFNGYGFTPLARLLAAVGFTDVRRFEPGSFAPLTQRDAAFAAIDGVRVSLNIEATKKGAAA